MAIQLAACGRRPHRGNCRNGREAPCPARAEILINIAEQDFVRCYARRRRFGADVILDHIGCQVSCPQRSAHWRSTAAGHHRSPRWGQGRELDISALLANVRSDRDVVAGDLWLRKRPSWRGARTRLAVDPVRRGQADRAPNLPPGSAAEAHRELEAGANIGKVLLTT